MSKRRVRIVLLCEDSQHEAFVRRFLKGMGWETGEIRVEKSPVASGSAEQWVRERFTQELKAYRNRATRAASALVAVIDADIKDLQDRIDEFRFECTKKNIEFRHNNENVAFAIPKRNIETWIRFLEGVTVDENGDYPKLQNKRECKTAVSNLVRICKTTGLLEDALSSLKYACNEYTFYIKPLQNQN